MEPIQRKVLKKAARKVVKKHYGLLLVVCLFAAFLGAEFTDALSVFSLTSAAETAAETTTDGTETTVLEDVVASYADTTASGGIGGMVEAILGNTLTDYYVKTVEMEETDKAKGFTILGFIPISSRKGILSSLANKISSGGIYITIFAGILSLTKSTTAAKVIFIILALLITLSFWALITNIYNAVAARLLLESRKYDKVPINRYMYFIRVRKYFNVVLTMLLKYIFLTLWNLTIVGGFIKYYSYRMVPFIIAENPSIKPLDAINLSRKMMDGHKWEAFLLDCSFIPWRILRFITSGLFGLFYLNSYIWATDAEYYAAVRAQFKDTNAAEAEVLNDKYLYEDAPEEELRDAYAELIEATQQVRENPYAKLNKVRLFFINWFGLVLNYQDPEANEYRDYQLYVQDKEMLTALLENKIYPTRLSPNPFKMKFKNRKILGPNRCYSIVSVILLFFIIAFVGWLWEVSIHLVKDGKFVNRGTLHGPWLPIYGAGAIMILILLKKLRSIPWLEFISAIVLCGFVEYFTHYYLWVNLHKKWWDYSGYLFNLNGRICAEGLIVFGLGGIAVVYLLAPSMDNIFRKVNHKILIIICAILVPIYVADSIYSHFVPNEGKGITDYKDDSATTVPAQSSSSLPACLVIPEI